MADRELGKLSSEQIQKLANTISEAKSLTSQQEEIITKVLEGEIEIGNTRIASLEKYFDIYSRNLDKVASKYSDLDDAFLVLNNKLTENYKKLSSDITKLSEQLKKATEDSGEATSNRSSKKSNETDDTKNNKPATQGLTSDLIDKDTASAIRQIAKALTERPRPDTATAYTPLSGGQMRDAFTVNGSSDGGVTGQSGQPSIPDTVDVGQIVTEASGELLRPERTSADIVEHLRSIETVRKAIEELHAAEEEARKTGDYARLEAAKNNYDQIAESHNEHLKTLKLARDKYLNSIIEAEEATKKKSADLELAKLHTQEMQEARYTEFRLKELDKVLDAELAAKEFENQLAAEIKFANSDEGIDLRIREAQAKDELASAKELAARKANFIVEAERQARLAAKNDDEYKEAVKRIRKEADIKFKADKETLEKLTKERLTQEAKEADKKKEAKKKELRELGENILTSGPLFGKNGIKARYNDFVENAVKNAEENGDDAEDAKTAAQIQGAVLAISSLAKQLENTVDQIASYKGDIDTRLQGSNNEKYAGSYWDRLAKDMISVGAVTPYFKQEDFANNIKTLVDRGIAFDLKQRAFLMTIQEKIANTFDVADGTLLRLIRIQQEDSTAGRLGMESALNSFLNEMYENTEYLKDVAASVRGSLQEMEALMGGAEATEVEYQVQKWMGSLYSVGMSQDAVQSIANALGQIAAGQVDALTSGNGAGNLLVMAANEAGIPIADILAEGLDSTETNKLLQATVNYLADIAESTEGNNVVQQQLANVFGVKASDLRAATNLAVPGTTEDIFKESLSYDNMLRQLYKMAGSMGLRTSLGEKMSNVWANGQYTLAGSMASNPMSYLLYKTATLLDNTVGGIDFSIPLIMGNGTAQTFNVADIMRVGAIGGGVLGSLGQLVKGLASSFSGHRMLASMGIESGSGLKVTPRGTGAGVGAGDAGDGGKSTSGSGYVGNANASDIKKSTIQETKDSEKKKLIEAKEEAESTQVDFININVLKIYELLDEVASGKRSLNVKVSGYGLTRASNSAALGSAQGGVAGLLSNTAASDYTDNVLTKGFGASSGASGSSSTDSFGNTNIGLGGWSMT